HFEVAARLLLAPGAGAGREPFQPERVVALRMADVAAGMAVALLQEDRLHTHLEELVVERRGRARGDGGRSSGCAHGGHHDELCETSGHANPPAVFEFGRGREILA